ncbi:hypothetical protein pdam_00019743 [Pocillopora damicornis]|uniref:Uncharacterized protein n=1 Tax=Pocillopora damicornis TaxID=46731 RepID=A0A3M6TW01_POCDA|nr:hypothetical protein pdam_00019743 [Pocillopora damicornis]
MWPEVTYELMIYKCGDFHLWIGNEQSYIISVFLTGKYMGQRNSDGALQFYKDGALSTHSSRLNGLKKGYEIRAGVSLVLERARFTLRRLSWLSVPPQPPEKKFEWAVVSFIPERSEGSQRLALQG